MTIHISAELLQCEQQERCDGHAIFAYQDALHAAPASRSIRRAAMPVKMSATAPSPIVDVFRHTS
jgi:hypothetical protein